MGAAVGATGLATTIPLPLYVTYAGLADYLHDLPEMGERAAELFAMMRSGAVKVPIHKRYPLADAAQAHADLEGRRTSGASLLIP